MKVFKSVTFISLAIILVTIVFFAFLPFGLSTSTISRQERIMFAIPTIILEILFFIKPRLQLKRFRVLLLMIAVVSIIATVAGGMNDMILVIFIIGLGAMSFPPGTNTIPINKN
jgi:hypothetical protein